MLDTKETRCMWVDGIKIYACCLVVLGHLCMSLVASGWISEEAVYYCLPIQTVYSFHVPLFFVCSGFLYQNKQTECSLKNHIRNIRDKAIALGVPYFTFSLITLALKIIFSREVNHQATPIIRTLLWEPIAPYWYLYTLFFLFCFIPRFRDIKKLKVAFVVTILVKVICVAMPWFLGFPDIITKLASNAIWFVLGMLLTQEDVRAKFRYGWLWVLTLGLGMLLSCMCYRENNSSRIIQFVVGVLFVYSFLSISFQINYEKVGDKILRLSDYFMPIYLMHTIFAAGIRTILLKIGVEALAIHFIVGLIVSFVLPMVVYEIARKFWILLFWIEPLKARRMKGNKNVRL